MDAVEVRRRLDAIRAGRGDDEWAHSEEDALYADVLLAIADGSLIGDEACEVADLALTSADIRFSRWYS